MDEVPEGKMIKDDACSETLLDKVWDLGRTGSNVPMMVMDEDETEWAAPAWCDIARSYGDHGRVPSFYGADDGADLRGSDLSGARLALAEFVRADARGAILVGAELSFADFMDANLVGADLSSADLCKADFRGADLRGAKLSGADLAYACLKNSNLRGANLSGACLDHADLSGSRFDFATELPFDMEEARARGMEFVVEPEPGPNRTRTIGGGYEP